MTNIDYELLHAVQGGRASKPNPAAYGKLNTSLSDLQATTQAQLAASQQRDQLNRDQRVNNWASCELAKSAGFFAPQVNCLQLLQ